jgi:hypothetical protein
VSAPDTREKFHDALRAYNQAGAGAAASGQQPDPAELAESSGLTAAAHAHIGASRPLADIKAAYDELCALRDAGEEIDATALQVLADELQPVRMAEAVMAGAYPGTGHIASAGIGT